MSFSHLSSGTVALALLAFLGSGIGSSTSSSPSLSYCGISWGRTLFTDPVNYASKVSMVIIEKHGRFN